MDKNLLKKNIVEMIDGRKRTVTFVQLSEIEGFVGNIAIGIPGMNVIIWEGISQTAHTCIHELLQEKKILARETAPIIYLSDGYILRYKRALRLDIPYKSRRWMPISFDSAKHKRENGDYLRIHRV